MNGFEGPKTPKQPEILKKENEALENLKQNDPYITWSDQQRMSEYAHTGDASYLTPQLAREMQVSVGAMREVPGVTNEDIAFAEATSEEQNRLLDEGDNEIYKRFGIDNDSLQNLDEDKKAHHILDIAGMYIGDSEAFEAEIAKNYARRLVAGLLIYNEGGVDYLLTRLRWDSVKGLRDLEVVQDTYSLIRKDFVRLSHFNEFDLSEEERQHGHATANVLNEFWEWSNLLEKNLHTDLNYLFAERLRLFIYEMCVEGTAEHNPGDVVPFEITKGSFAVFSADEDRIYVVDDPDIYEEIELELYAVSPIGIQFQENGQYFARHMEVEIPDAFQWMYEKIVDAGTPIHEMGLELPEDSPELLHDYSILLHSRTRSVIEDDFSLDLSDLTIREQLYFLSFLKNVTIAEAKHVQEFTKTYGTSGMRAFLALGELGKEYGNVIASRGIEAVEHGQEELMLKIFGEFLDIEEKTQEAEKYLAENFNAKDTQTVKEVIKGIRQKAATLLSELLSEPVTEREDEKRILEEVKAANKDNALFVNAFKTLKKRGDLNLAEIKDTTFESVSGEVFSEEDTKRMEEIVEKNWGRESSEFLEVIKKSLDTALRNERSTFYTLRHNGEIIGFNRFDDNTEGEKPHIYFGSFNTDPSFGNGKLGEAIYEQSFKQQLERGLPIEADCDPLSPITSKYIESGFLATEFTLYGSKPSFHIVHRGKDAEPLPGQQLSKEEIIERAEKARREIGEMNIRVVHQGDRFPELSQGMVLSRYFTENDRTYAVFEKASV